MMLALGAPVIGLAPPPHGFDSSRTTNNWQCGTPLVDGTTAEVSQTVTTAYAEFKNTYLQQMSDDTCCIKRPGEKSCRAFQHIHAIMHGASPQ